MADGKQVMSKLKKKCVDCQTYMVLSGLAYTCRKTTYCRLGEKTVHLWDDRSIACDKFQTKHENNHN